MKQYNSIWPLPGGVEKYFETLLTILRHVQDQEPPLEKMVEDFKVLFPDSKDNHTIRTQLLIHAHLGYWKNDTGKYQLVADGHSLLSQPDTVTVYHRGLCKHTLVSRKSSKHYVNTSAIFSRF